MRSSLIVLMLLTLASPVSARYDAGNPDAPRHPDPIELGNLFCNARIAGDMSLVDAHVAPVLKQSIAAVADLAERFRQRFPDKPVPLAEGLPWQTFPDQPARCAIEIVNGIDKAPIILVKLSYFVDGDAQPKWADTIQLDRTPDHWLIDNVFYAHGGNMRFKLLEAFNS
jgi:hypothetical protein